MRSKKSHPSTLPSSSFIPAISTVAVAQICLSAGYTSAEPAALRSLTSVASLYLRTLAASASSIAHTKGRTQSNLLDLIRAIEDLAIAQSGGFAGGSDPTRNLLESSVLKELRSFVRSVKEVPFPKPIRKDARVSSSSAAARSFAEVGREAPGAHVPRWLPCFPEGWEDGGRKGKRSERGEERRRWEEKGGIFEEEFREVEEEDNKLVGGLKGRRDNGVMNKRVLQQNQQQQEGELWMPSYPGCCWEMKELGFSMAERERVQFRLMGENSKWRKEKKLALK